MPQPTLRPQDVLILAKLLAYAGRRPPMAQMGIDLFISPSEVHAALKRLAQARLITDESAMAGSRPLLPAVEEFLIHGVKYAFPATRGEVTRGVPTSYAAPPLNARVQAGSDLPPVWPFPQGTERGVSLQPLYRSVPAAALRDAALYELLSLIDALRDGRARERKLAEQALRARLNEQPDGSDRSEPSASRTRR